MEIINKSKFIVLVNDADFINEIGFNEKTTSHLISFPVCIYQKLTSELILIKKITEFCNKIIIKDSLIENEVEIEVIK